MKAIQIHTYGHADQMKLETVSRPSIQKGQILVKIHDAGVNPVDWKIREGFMKDIRPKSFPFTLGRQACKSSSDSSALRSSPVCPNTMCPHSCRML